MAAAEWRREGCFLIWTGCGWKGSILVEYRNTVNKTLGQVLCFSRFGRAWAFEWQTRTSETRSEGMSGAVSGFGGEVRSFANLRPGLWRVTKIDWRLEERGGATR